MFGPSFQGPGLCIDVAIFTEQLATNRISLRQQRFVRHFEIHLRFHPTVRVSIHQSFRSAITPVGRGRVKDTVLKDEGVPGVHFEVAYLDLNGINFIFSQLEWCVFEMTAAGHHGQPTIWLMEIRQAVADFHADQWQVFMAEIAWDPNVAMPATTKSR